MIYAYIYPGKLQSETEQSDFYLDFYGNGSDKEEVIWDKLVSEYIRLKIKGVDTKKETLIKHLAERGFIPGGDSIFYKKGLLDFFR